MKTLEILGLSNCRIRSHYKIAKEISNKVLPIYVEKSEEHYKSQVLHGIIKELSKRSDIISKTVEWDYEVYQTELFVFSRKELQKLIDHIIENR